MRLIDADNLEKDAEWDANDGGFMSYSQLQIDNAPTIDAVEVVRCRDCKYQITETLRYGSYQVCSKDEHEGIDGGYPNIISQDWFCFDGERKEDLSLGIKTIDKTSNNKEMQE